MIIMKMQVMLNLLLPFFYFRNKNFSNSNCIGWLNCPHREETFQFRNFKINLRFGENFHLFANTNPPPTVPVFLINYKLQIVAPPETDAVVMVENMRLIKSNKYREEELEVEILTEVTPGQTHGEVRIYPRAR